MPPPFPSREELLSRGYWPKTVEELYDLWQEAHREALALAARLPEVFGDPPRPAITRSVARGLDDEWILTEERYTELLAQDSEQHWMDVTAEDVKNCQEYFSFSDAEGCRFYYPAYLRHYLEGFPLYWFTAVREACIFRTHLELLSEKQLEFIDEFMKLCATWEN
ncbi:hypothetical protein DES53_1045 [Roseimicrobium gellanilyticum]|uniref:Uncharacterized protein n=1 Tax=Roseimicrobium gellanilyticum TaxID=748857 RepID=A0A366HN19_9BACT|nr:DUF6714 family protein [Roseimicrobium gellanilyticum]RBP44186.1 hypothetical protein DES53_1045 [Roseimicrobium gellanilyticum]